MSIARAGRTGGFCFEFAYSESGPESRHEIEMGGVLEFGELPPVGDVAAVIVESSDGHWTINAKGRIRQNGCTGEGDGLLLTVTVEAL
jgi:hypothetical protein